jgi:hypothetical protein
MLCMQSKHLHFTNSREAVLHSSMTVLHATCCLAVLPVREHAPQDAHLRFTMTRENGVTYSMAVPILRPEPSTDEGEAEDTADFDAEFETEYNAEFDAEFDAELQVDLQAGQAAADLSEVAAAVAEAAAGPWGEDGAYAVVADSSDSYAVINEPAAADANITMEPSAAAVQAVHAAVQPGPKGWAVRAGSTSRAGSRAGRGVSPAAVEVPTDGSPVMTPDMLKELLVEELVQDVEELVEHMGPQAAVRAMDAGEDGAQRI